MRSYKEMIKLKTFKERFEYLKLDGTVGDAKFGFARYLNQKFYKSPQWRRIRNLIIIRDCGCDLGDLDRPILGDIYVHHINPISIEDLQTNNYDKLLNQDNLICCSLKTHEAITYCGELEPDWSPRTKDEIPWR